MENKLENINRIYAFRVSPLQSYVNMAGKDEVIDSFKNQLWHVWFIPLFLTWGELVCIKHQKIKTANSVALFKFASIPTCVALSFYFYSKLQHKIHYFDVVYPHASQTQIEFTKDSLMLKQNHN